MNALLQVEFPDRRLAAKALKILRTRDLPGKSAVEMRVKENALLVAVDSASYSSLRARVTSVLREIKLVFDAISIVGGKGGKR